MAPFTIHSRHSWPPGTRSASSEDPSFDENPFAFYISPPEDDDDDDIDAGITTTPPRSRSRSPFSLARRRSFIFNDESDYSDDYADEDEDNISTVRMAESSPSAVLRRWAHYFEKSYPHLSLKALHVSSGGGKNAETDDDYHRGRGNRVILPAMTPEGPASRRRSRSWQPPAVELFTVEEEGDEGFDSGVEEARAKRVREVSRGRTRGRGRTGARGRTRARAGTAKL